MTSTVMNPVKAFVLITLGLAIAAMGIYVANADDAPGAAVIGFLLMLVAVLFAVRTARNRLPIWAGRTALAVGVLVAAFAAFLTHAVTVAAPLFAQPPDVPRSSIRHRHRNMRRRSSARGRSRAESGGRGRRTEIDRPRRESDSPRENLARTPSGKECRPSRIVNSPNGLDTLDARPLFPVDESW